jgi:hypothetical protein
LIPDVTFRPQPYPFRFSEHDYRPLTPNALAMQMRLSRGFIQLCFDAGCPRDRRNDSISGVGLLHWLFDYYEEVRALAGMRPLAPVSGLKPHTLERLRMANAITTLLEYARTRATDWRQKRQLRQALEEVDRLADSVA